MVDRRTTAIFGAVLGGWTFLGLAQMLGFTVDAFNVFLLFAAITGYNAFDSEVKFLPDVPKTVLVFSGGFTFGYLIVRVLSNVGIM